MLWGLKPVEAKPAYGLAVEGLRHQIHTGLLLPGERLPAERALADRFGISRVTLREALRILESHHYISVRRGAHGGAFVADMVQLDTMAHHRLLRAPAVAMRVLEFLAINQLAAARLAAHRRDPAHLARLRQIFDMMREALDAPLRKQAQTLFFLGIGDAARNVLLARAIEDGLSELFLPFSVKGENDEKSDNLALFADLLVALEQECVEACAVAMTGLHDKLWTSIRQMIQHAPLGGRG